MSRYCGTCEQYKCVNDFSHSWSLQCGVCHKKVLDDIHIRQVKFNTEERKAIIEKNIIQIGINVYVVHIFPMVTLKNGMKKLKHIRTI